MKFNLLFLTTAALLSLNSFVSTGPIERDNDISVDNFLEDDVPVPSNNDLFVQEFKDCGSPSDFGKVQKVSFTPENPIAGKPLTITTTTFFKKQVLPGAQIKVTVKLGFIPVKTSNYNLCDFVSCPLEPGVHTYSMQVKIPAGTPSLKLNYRSISESVDDERFTCVEGSMQITNE